VVNAIGPWTGAVRGSKGAHVAVPRDRVGNRNALTLLSPHDGRVLFALPAGPHTIIGTTDTYGALSPDEVRASNDDVRYLLDSANTFFPSAMLTPSDVVSAWAGIRPLLPSAGATPGAASREHAITTDDRGVVTITGGKLTTYRIMARDAVEAVLARLSRPVAPDRTASTPLPGGEFSSLDALIGEAARATNDLPLAAHLATAYGTRWPLVWREINQPGARAAVCEGLPYTVGELRYGAINEMACTLGDVLIRRTHVAFETRDHGIAAAERAAVALAPVFGWDDEMQRNAVAAYADEVERMFAVIV
jgi:glycerol-3-phosphate dehydrogenase